MTVQISPIFGAGAQRFVNTGPNGLVPNSAGLIYTYQGGTTTPQATYTDSTGATPQANPIVLDANGRVPNEIWLTAGQTYKFVETDQYGNTLGTWDLIPGIASNTDIATIQATLTGYATSFTTVALTVSGTAGFNVASFSGATTFGGALNAGSNTLTIGNIAASGTGIFAAAVTAPLFTSATSTPYYMSSGGVAGTSSWGIDLSQRLLNYGNSQESCFAGLTANQTAGTTIVCNSVALTGGHNYGAGYSTSLGNFTAQVAGTCVYSIAAQGSVSNTGGAGTMLIAFLVNSTQVATQTLTWAAAGTENYAFAFPAIALASGAVVSVAIVAGGSFTAFSASQFVLAGATFSARLQG